MTGQDERIVHIVAPCPPERDDGDDPVSRLPSIGWKVVPAGDAPRGTGDALRLFLLDARLPDALEKWEELADGEAATCLALVGREQEAGDGLVAALIAAGVTHLLPWPADDRELALALEAARGLALRRGMELAETGGEGEESLLTPLPHDALTGLVSRAAARRRLAQELSAPDEPGRNGVTICLLIGISQFDSVNAAYGKPVGDAVLVQIARRISRCVEQVAGPEALVARMGGTEYLVAFRSRGGRLVEGEARDLARLILTDVARPFCADDNMIRLTARCGIAECAPGDDAARLLRRASAALADARRSGTSDIWFRSGRRHGGEGAGGDPDRLDADLRLALDRNEIAIVYQPQYDSLKDVIVGVEALARWNHPALGQLDAGTLFAAADRSDYLLPLSLHIQQRALNEAGQWPEALNRLRLSINVTSVDLAQDDFVERLLAMVGESGFPPGRLTVEITESGLIENIERAAAILRDLRGRGIRVAIDDFGTGYSSLAYLKALYPDYLKIDHSLSRDILGTSRDRIILRAIIAMARSLALTVIAEGVESEEQLTLLAREGCEIYQGFLRSAAVTSAGLAELVAKA